MSKPLTIADHDRIRAGIARAEQLAAYTLTAIRGRTAQEVAAAVAARAIAALRQKGGRP
jgi:hypothetical protein